MKQSAGILLYKKEEQGLAVFLAHPGGPFWAKKDLHAWSIPKGEFDDIEEPRSAAWREFKEETGLDVPDGEPHDLGTFKVSSNKQVYVWAIEADIDPKQVKSNTFELEWPPKSGKVQQHPEIDKAAWFPLADAQVKIVKGQLGMLEALAAKIGIPLPPPADEPAASTPHQTAGKMPAPPKGDDQQTSLF